MSRRLHTWKIRNREIALGDRTLIMGVLNVTPDSFSDGGDYLDPDRAFARAMEMEEQGADIIDIGAESTKPGAQPVTASEEMQRLVPVLKRLREKLSIPISVDTYKAEVAERALELGVEIINDPSGFTFDPQIAKPVVQYNAGFILNHMRGRPETWATLGPMPDVMSNIVKDLDASVNRARRAGVDRLRMMVDPGLGFGKRREQNAEILARLDEMKRLELPILVGPSRKSFLAQSEERETEFATAAAVTASVLAGVHLVRVHDVAAMRAVVAVADEIWRAAQRLSEAKASQAAEATTSRRAPRPAVQKPEVEATPVRPAVRPPLIRDFQPRVQPKDPEPRPEVEMPPPPPVRTERRPAAAAPGSRPRFEKSGPAKPRGDRPRFEKSGPAKSGPTKSGPTKRDGDKRRFERSGPPKREPVTVLVSNAPVRLSQPVTGPVSNAPVHLSLPVTVLDSNAPVHLSLPVTVLDSNAPVHLSPRVTVLDSNAPVHRVPVDPVHLDPWAASLDRAVHAKVRRAISVRARVATINPANPEIPAHPSRIRKSPGSLLAPGKSCSWR